MPPSGVAQKESLIPLPSDYVTHEDAGEQEQSSLYFLACISLRRLLNRVHHLLYADAHDTASDVHRFPRVVAELDYQLEEWHSVLPASLSFSVDMAQVEDGSLTEAGAFLRQRYLTCRSVIYRPFLSYALFVGAESDVHGTHTYAHVRGIHELSADFVEGSKVCLNSCLLHIRNLRGFSHTVLVDSWICSLSYV